MTTIVSAITVTACLFSCFAEVANARKILKNLKEKT